MKTINEMYDLLRIKLSKDCNIDNPSEYDLSYSEVFWEEWWWESVIKYDLNIIKNNLTIFNQLQQTLTNMACWCYWSTHCINAMNIIESNSLWSSYEQKNPMLFWKDFLINNPTALYQWSSLQDWISFFVKKWLISGSVRCYTIEEAKRAIDNNRLIYTWSNNWDWNKVKTIWKYWIKTKSFWHLFCLIWYNDEWFIWVNSLNDWYFILSYEYWNTLYSRNALCDTTNKEAFDTYNKIIEEIKLLDYETWLFPYYDKAKKKYWEKSRMFEIIKNLLRRRFIYKNL